MLLYRIAPFWLEGARIFPLCLSVYNILYDGQSVRGHERIQSQQAFINGRRKGKR